MEDERTRRIDPAPLSPASIGRVTVFSTSSADSPGASVITTTVGAFKSGKISISIRINTDAPAIRINPNAIRIAALLESDPFIILFSISINDYVSVLEG